LFSGTRLAHGAIDSKDGSLVLLNTVLFTGNANPVLSQEIATHLGLELGKAVVGRFSDGEVTVEIQQNDNFITMFWEGYFQYRKIYMEGKPRPDAILNTRMGYSVGHWEGDTLVVTTKGFNEDFWMTNGGLPHTSNLVLNERFTRSDMNTLQYQVTVDDSGAYTRPWTASWTMQWVPDQEVPIHFCQDNRP